MLVISTLTFSAKGVNGRLLHSAAKNGRRSQVSGFRFQEEKRTEGINGVLADEALRV